MDQPDSGHLEEKHLYESHLPRVVSPFRCRACRKSVSNRNILDGLDGGCSWPNRRICPRDNKCPDWPDHGNYSGEVASETNINNTYPSWQPASSFTGGNIDNAPPAGDIIAQNGGPGTRVNTITFSQPINNPVMALWSLGNPSLVTQYVFPTNEKVNIEGADRLMSTAAVRSTLCLAQMRSPATRATV